MNELMFRGRDLFRPSWSHLSLLLLVFAAQVTVGVLKLGVAAMFWMIGGTLVLVIPATLVAWRSWSRVGADGVTVCWGIGSGRTYSWSEIRWIDVRETKGNGTRSYAARIFLLNGRRRSLPGLQTSTLYPIEEFEANFQRVLDWWESSTPDAAERVRPGKQARDWITPQVAGALIAVVFIAVTFVVVAARR
ncbi:hypothetical protein ACH4E7_11300 [Kitasatospora sp. NPDC018058]|uniref:hypothetical protein n=1 Tax=Kitasatospora sp. NPDC018058 TaxID=3364025 RepID=UPI0037BF416D